MRETELKCLLHMSVVLLCLGVPALVHWTVYIKCQAMCYDVTLFLTYDLLQGEVGID